MDRYYFVNQPRAGLAIAKKLLWPPRVSPTLFEFLPEFLILGSGFVNLEEKSEGNKSEFLYLYLPQRARFN